MNHIEQKIEDACQKMILLGWTIVDQVSFSRVNRCCCPLGAVIATSPGSSHLELVCSALDVDFEWARSFVSAFDGAGDFTLYVNGRLHSEASTLGRKFRRKYVLKEI